MSEREKRCDVMREEKEREREKERECEKPKKKRKEALRRGN
jgi:hypothetical protein